HAGHKVTNHLGSDFINRLAGNHRLAEFRLVVAGRRDDVNAGGAGDLFEFARRATDLDGRHFDQRLPPRGFEMAEFLYRCLDVRELQRGVRLKKLGWRAKNQVVMTLGYAQIGRSDRPKHGLNSCHGSYPSTGKWSPEPAYMTGLLKRLIGGVTSPAPHIAGVSGDYNEAQ